MRLHLQRFAELHGATLGWLSGPNDFSLFTIERPWLDNERNVSCVPDGFYALEPHDSENHPDTVALVGQTVSHFPDPSALRDVILFDVANRASELNGCIALGTDITQFRDNPFLTFSSESMDRLRECLSRDSRNYLTISHSEPR